jgi:hypothetical protein
MFDAADENRAEVGRMTDAGAFIMGCSTASRH